MRITIVSPYITKLFFPECRIGFGGAEVGQSILAEELVAQGHEVAIVCCKPGLDAESTTVRGIQFLFIPDTTVARARSATLSIYYKLLKSVRLSRPDIIYQATAGPLTVILGAFARIARIPFVFRAANDLDLKPEYASTVGRLRGTLFTLGLRLAHTIIVQTPVQQQLLQQHFGLTATVVQNCKRVASVSSTSMSTREGLLWVGRLSLYPNKNPEHFLAIARRYPQISCTMIAPGSGDEYEHRIRREAAALSNVKLLAFVPNTEIGGYFASARLFVGTGTAEGFPNTYLEASVHSTPILSLVTDPDSYLSSTQAGIVVNTPEELVDRVGAIYDDRAKLEALGANGRQTVMNRYDAATVAQRYVEVFSKALNSRCGADVAVKLAG